MWIEEQKCLRKKIYKSIHYRNKNKIKHQIKIKKNIRNTCVWKICVYTVKVIKIKQQKKCSWKVGRKKIKEE